jgi:hypothetical protein
MSEGNFLPEILDGLATGGVRLNEAPSEHEQTSGRGTNYGEKPKTYTTCECCGRPTQKLICDRCSESDYESLRF